MTDAERAWMTEIMTERIERHGELACFSVNEVKRLLIERDAAVHAEAPDPILDGEIENDETDYRAARSLFNVSAAETKRRMGTSILQRLDPEGISDTKLVELVMIAMYRVREKK